jgi:acetolactate synthase I/II/III large subunit
MSEMTGAEALIESLSREGVEVVFGVPGVQIMELLDAFCRIPKVRWITTRHEQTAAYMAFGYARSTGKEGVVMAVPGPGVFNTCAAIGTAYAASTPVLLLAGQIDRPNLGKNQGILHEVTEQLDVFKPITKWNKRVMETADIPASIEMAIQKLRTGRPRPVEVEFPFDLWAIKKDMRFNKIEEEKPPVDRTKIKKAAAILADAKRPLIWAGGGVITGNASDELTQLAEKLNSPVVMTPEGKGAISEAHPLACGNINFNTNVIMSQADVIIVFGSRFLPRQPLKPGPAGVKVIQIDIDPEEVGRNWPLELGITADMRQALTALLEELPATKKSQWKASEIEKLRTDFISKCEKAAPIQTKILRDIREELEDDAIVVCGVTNIGYWSQITFPVYKPRTFITSSYFTTLGYSFPTALGAKAGNPDKQVISINGDGGFLFAATDLATAVQQRLNVVSIVFNDNIYGATYHIQQNRYQNRIFGTELLNPDFAALAESFGAKGVKLLDHKGLKDALRSALKEKGPVVIEVPIPNMCLPWEVL